MHINLDKSSVVVATLNNYVDINLHSSPRCDSGNKYTKNILYRTHFDEFKIPKLLRQSKNLKLVRDVGQLNK